MITIENIQKLGNSIKYPTTTLTLQSHYKFIIDYDKNKLEFTLSRISPVNQNGDPHPNAGKYLLLCRGEMIWFTKDKLKNIDNVLSAIYMIMYKLC